MSVRPAAAGARIGLPLAATLASFLAVSACGQLDLLVDIAFPPGVPGLSDAGWVDLPVDLWVTEGDVRARAISACLSAACGARAAVGVFAAEGREGAVLADLAARPAGLKAQLERAARTDPVPRRRRAGLAVAVEPLAAGRLRGYTIRMSNAGGGGVVHGAVLASRRDGRPTDIVIAVTAGDDAARLAARVATALP